MASDDNAELERELHGIEGALELLDTLREEFAEWLEEAPDESQREALENVLGHIEALQLEYRTREEDARKDLEAG